MVSIEAIVRDLIGKPFKDGGRGPEYFDCYGLVIEIYKRAGIELPNYPISCWEPKLIDRQIREAKKLWNRCDINNPAILSVVVIRNYDDPEVTNHTGVYVGNGKFLHILEKTGVILTPVDHPYWTPKIEGYYVPGWLE